MAAASVISCSTKNVKMSLQVGLQCHRVAWVSRVISQGLTEGREHKNNPPEKLRSFLDPLDDTPFLFLFDLFVFLSGLVVLSLIWLLCIVLSF
jgi:hypothetical protein